jgi:hypothetical protein
MPIATLENGFTALKKFRNQLVQRFHYFIALSDCQGSTGTKIVLHIYHYQRTFLCF